MNPEAIVIGTSSGGFNALQAILAPLPAEFPLPIVIVQHRRPAPNDFLEFSLNESCQLTVKEADEKEPIRPGYVYIALAGSDAKSLYLLYPNEIDQDNKVAKGQALVLPRNNWETIASGPVGRDTLLVMVTDTPRRLDRLRAQPEHAIPLAVRRASTHQETVP